MKALIVEDSKSYQQLVENILNDLGLAAFCVRNGAEALKWAENDNFDLICLDMELSDMNGFELCQQFQGKETTSLIPIIIMAEEEDPMTLKQGYKAGITEIFRKSTAKELLHSMTEFVGRMRRVMMPGINGLDVLRWKASWVREASFPFAYHLEPLPVLSSENILLCPQECICATNAITCLFENILFLNNVHSAKAKYGDRLCKYSCSFFYLQKKEPLLKVM